MNTPSEPITRYRRPGEALVVVIWPNGIVHTVRDDDDGLLLPPEGTGRLARDLMATRLRAIADAYSSGLWA